MSRFLKPLLVLWLCLATANVFALKADAASVASKSFDPYLQLAKFHYYKGDSNKALLTIEQAASLWPVSDTSDRYIFSAEVLVEQKRFFEAQKAFNKVLRNKQALALMGKVSFSLAHLHFAKGNCKKALRLLKISKKDNAETMLQSFYLRSNCLALDSNAELATLERLQGDIADYIKEHKKDKQLTLHSMLLAYSYYNLAVVAQNLRLDLQAFELFETATHYSVGAPESQSFVERIKLTQAYSKYTNHQFDESLALFSKMSLDGLWVDQSLLGFGWSAYHTYQRGLALEAWRQLVNLPQRSINVYEAMLTVPYVLEKAKSFSRALKAYDFAVDNYAQALTEIDDLEANLALPAIHQHALDYVDSLQTGKTVKPLHPLLVTLYTKREFLQAVTRVGEVAYRQKKLGTYKAELDTLSASLDWKPAPSSSTELETRSKAIEERLTDYKKSVYALRTHMLDEAMNNPKVSREIRTRYDRYADVREMAKKYGVQSERMQRLQGVILWQLYESGEYPSSNLVTISEMLASQRMLQARLDNLPKSLDAMGQMDRPSVEQVAMLQARTVVLNEKLTAVSMKSEQYLLNMTLSVLADYRVTIEGFQKQARVARARLREEFYQLGGKKYAH